MGHAKLCNSIFPTVAVAAALEQKTSLNRRVRDLSFSKSLRFKTVSDYTGIFYLMRSNRFLFLLPQYLSEEIMRASLLSVIQKIKNFLCL